MALSPNYDGSLAVYDKQMHEYFVAFCNKSAYDQNLLGVLQLPPNSNGSSKNMTKDTFVLYYNGSFVQLPEGATEDSAYERAAEIASQHRTKVYVLKPIGSEAPETKTVRVTF